MVIMYMEKLYIYTLFLSVSYRGSPLPTVDNGHVWWLIIELDRE